MTNLGPLRTLAELEAVIANGLQTFIEVGRALLEVRDRDLYKDQGFHTFPDYCRERWKMSQPHAQHMIDASKVAENLITTVINLPTERQARELAGLAPE